MTGPLEGFETGGEIDEGEFEGKGASNGFENPSTCLLLIRTKNHEAAAHLRGPFTGMTSRPIPSPGIRPIRNDFEAIGNLFPSSHGWEKL